MKTREEIERIESYWDLFGEDGISGEKLISKLNELVGRVNELSSPEKKEEVQVCEYCRNECEQLYHCDWGWVCSKHSFKNPYEVEKQETTQELVNEKICENCIASRNNPNGAVGGNPTVGGTGLTGKNSCCSVCGGLLNPYETTQGLLVEDISENMYPTGGFTKKELRRLRDAIGRIKCNTVDEQTLDNSILNKLIEQLLK